MMLAFLRAIFPRIHYSLLFRFKRNEQGGAAVEVAVLLPLLLTGGLLFTDLYRIGIERTRMEQVAGSAGITLSVQQKLGKAGLDGLYNALIEADDAQGSGGRHQMVVTNVTMPSRRIWWRLSRGVDSVCEQDAAEGSYQGSLPEDSDTVSAGDPDDDTYSLVVVQLCRLTDDFSLHSLGVTDRLQVYAFNRTPGASVALDELLLEEAVGAIQQAGKEL